MAGLRRLRNRALLVCLLALTGCDWWSALAGNPPLKPRPPLEEPPSEITDTVTVHSLGSITGQEAFISIGGVKGFDHAAVLSALQAAYNRNGFRVHWAVAPLSLAPLERKMAQVANEYRTGGTELGLVVFHHTGHGWGDSFAYERDALRGATRHTQLVAALDTRFPDQEPFFRDTRFVRVMDGCGLGESVDLRQASRVTYTMSSSPRAVDAAACQANRCTYTCPACIDQLVPVYAYSTEFARTLNGTSQLAFRDAHNAGSNLLVSNFSCSRHGLFRRFGR